MKNSVREVLREGAKRFSGALVFLAFGSVGLVMSMLLGGIAGIISLFALFVLAVWLLLYPEIRSSTRAVCERMEQFRKKG